MRRLENSLGRAALATAISMAVGSACADSIPRNKIRLQLDDVISSLPDTPIDESPDGRLAVQGLIQSHPDPLYIALEERYEALPPFTSASEDIPEKLIAAATLQERVSDGFKEVAGGVARFVPRVRTSIRQDDIRESSPDENTDYSVLVASVNPTFEYLHEKRKWQVRARYDLDRKKYYGDRSSNLDDHRAEIDYTLKLEKGNTLEVSSSLYSIHDVGTRDPIIDFDSTVRSNDVEENQYQLSFAYRNGTEQERSRYNVFYVIEKSDISAENYVNSGYELDRNGIGGTYVWQARRQLALVTEGRYQTLDYDLDYRDNDHYQVLVGSDLVFGRRIRARLRLGYEGKRFDSALSGNSFGRPVWRGALEWALRRSTTVKLETGREVFELADNNQEIDTTTFNVRDWVKAAWNEHWTDRLSTNASYTYRDTSVTGAITNQDASAQQLIVSAAYQFSEKLKFAVDSAITRSDTNLGEKLRRHTFTVRTDYSL